MVNPQARRAASDAASRSGVLLSSEAPVLRVETQGPDSIVIGKAAEFTVEMVNDGSVDANGVQARIVLPAWVQVVSTDTDAGTVQPRQQSDDSQQLQWEVETVAARGAERLRMVLKPLDSRPFDLAVDWTVRPSSAVTQITVQQPGLEMALFGPKDMLFGKTAVFTIQLTNPGTGDAEDVVLEFAYGQRRLEPNRLGTLAAGSQTEVDVELTATEAGSLLVAAVATAAGDLRAESEHEMLVRRGQLAIDVVGPPVEFAGAKAAYQVSVTNTGNAACSGVEATVVLPRGAKPTTMGDFSRRGGEGLAWRVGTLSPGEERVMDLECQLTVAGANRVEAVVRAGDGLEAIQACVTDVKALADLKLLVNDPRGPTAVGDDAVYELQIVNRGTDAAEQVQIVAQFSDGIEPVEAHGGSADIVPGQVLFQPIARLEPGAELTLKVVARANTDGIHRFRAQVTCAEPDTRLVAEESTYFFNSANSRTARRN
jgi:hypothetical protein